MRIDKHCTNIRIFRKKFQRRKYKFKKFRFKTIIEVPKWETRIDRIIELSIQEIGISGYILMAGTTLWG